MRHLVFSFPMLFSKVSNDTLSVSNWAVLYLLQHASSLCLCDSLGQSPSEFTLTDSDFAASSREISKALGLSRRRIPKGVKVNTDKHRQQLFIIKSC